jgi:hypothetical protein
MVDSVYRAEKFDWNEPTFDPSHPERFSSYLAEHRRWMVRLFSQQFGVSPEL